MSERTQIIYSAGQIDEAVLLKQMLDERGIESFVENEVLQGGIGGLPPGESTNPRVRVDEHDAEKAREVVKAFEHQQHLARQRVVEVDADYDDEWTDWPTCPGCQRRRQTVCPVCETAGTDLPLADPNHAGLAPTLGPNKDSADVGGPMLLCTTCDEPFHPRFYQICQWCGHQHADGIPPPPKPQASEKLSLRVWAVLGGLAALVAGMFGYFWWITQ